MASSEEDMGAALSRGMDTPKSCMACSYGVPHAFTAARFRAAAAAAR